MQSGITGKEPSEIILKKMYHGGFVGCIIFVLYYVRNLSEVVAHLNTLIASEAKSFSIMTYIMEINYAGVIFSACHHYLREIESFKRNCQYIGIGITDRVNNHLKNLV